jgi:hypothetical protein
LFRETDEPRLESECERLTFFLREIFSVIVLDARFECVELYLNGIAIFSLLKVMISVEAKLVYWRQQSAVLQYNQ